MELAGELPTPIARASAVLIHSFITRVAGSSSRGHGVAVMARVRATNAPLSRCHLGTLPPNTRTQAPAYDPRSAPLETLVERRRMRAIDASEARMLANAVEAGLHFLRMLELQPMSQTYRAAFIAKFALQTAPTGCAASATVPCFRATISPCARCAALMTFRDERAQRTSRSGAGPRRALVIRLLAWPRLYTPVQEPAQQATIGMRSASITRGQRECRQC